MATTLRRNLPRLGTGDIIGPGPLYVTIKNAGTGLIIAGIISLIISGLFLYVAFSDVHKGWGLDKQIPMFLGGIFTGIGITPLICGSLAMDVVLTIDPTKQLEQKQKYHTEYGALEPLKPIRPTRPTKQREQREQIQEYRTEYSALKTIRPKEGEKMAKPAKPIQSPPPPTRKIR